jgi:hypothetical protein
MTVERDDDDGLTPDMGIHPREMSRFVTLSSYSTQLPASLSQPPCWLARRWTGAWAVATVVFILPTNVILVSLTLLRHPDMVYSVGGVVQTEAMTAQATPQE